MATHTDGTIQVGGFTATINATSYIFETATLTLPSKRVERMDENDAPAAAYTYDGWPTGNATIQVNTAAAKADLRGLTFSTSEFTNASLTFVVTECSKPITSGANVVQTINFSQVVN